MTETRRLFLTIAFSVLFFYGPFACKDDSLFTQFTSRTEHTYSKSFDLSDNTRLNSKDIVSVFIGETASDETNFFVVSASQGVLRINFPECFRCRVEGIEAVSNGVFLKGTFTLGKHIDHAANFNLVFWDFHRLKGLYQGRLAKWYSSGDEIIFAAPSEQMIYRMNQKGEVTYRANLDRWQDFKLQDEGELFIASDQPWPEQKSKVFYSIENASRLVSGLDFHLETSFLEDDILSENRRCERFNSYWRFFVNTSSKQTRSRIPTFTEAGAETKQAQNHIFSFSADRTTLFPISRRSTIPSFHNFVSRKLSKVDSDQNIAFDGFNLVRYNDQITKAHQLIRYNFLDLDYVIKLFGPIHGLSKWTGITKDGYLVRIFKNGAINYDFKYKIIHSSPTKLDLFELDDKLFAFDNRSKQILSLDIGERFVQTSALNDAHIFQNKLSQLLVIDKLAIFMISNEMFSFDGQKIEPATFNNCLVLAIDSQSQSELMTIERCHDKSYRKIYEVIEGKLKITKSDHYPSLDSFLSQHRISDISLFVTNERFRVTRYNEKRCNFSSKVFDQNPKLVVLPSSKNRSKILTSKKLQGKIVNAFSVDERRFIVNVESNREVKSIIIGPSQEVQKLDQLTGWNIHNFQHFQFDDYVVWGNHEGENRLGVFNADSFDIVNIPIDPYLKVSDFSTISRKRPEATTTFP